LFAFALLDRGSMREPDVKRYIEGVPVYAQMREGYLGGSNAEMAAALVNDLVRARAIVCRDGTLYPNMRA
jgi:hypothetical protein